MSYNAYSGGEMSATDTGQYRRPDASGAGAMQSGATPQAPQQSTDYSRGATPTGESANQPIGPSPLQNFGQPPATHPDPVQHFQNMLAHPHGQAMLRQAGWTPPPAQGAPAAQPAPQMGAIPQAGASFALPQQPAQPQSTPRIPNPGILPRLGG